MMINNILALIIVFLGLFVGLFISYFAKEELSIVKANIIFLILVNLVLIFHFL